MLSCSEVALIGRLSGTRPGRPMVHAAIFIYLSIFSVFVFFSSHACCCCNFLWISHSNLYQPPLLSSLCHLCCLSPGFSGVPEDLLPDFDLKIMPGMGIMYFPPHLLPSIHTNTTYCSNHGCRTIRMVVVVGYTLGWIFAHDLGNLGEKMASTFDNWSDEERETKCFLVV